jgi:hypothetical protein
LKNQTSNEHSGKVVIHTEFGSLITSFCRALFSSWSDRSCGISNKSMNPTTSGTRSECMHYIDNMHWVVTFFCSSEMDSIIRWLCKYR